MCKEDIRIKRQTASQTIAKGTTQGVWVVVFPAHPGRVAVTVGYQAGSPVTAGTMAVVGSGDAVAPGAILGISPSRPADSVTIEQVGILITGQIVVFTDDGAAPDILVTQVYFTHALADL